MSSKLSIPIFALVIGLALPAISQDKPTPVRIRAVLHDPARPQADLYYADQNGTLLKIEFRQEDLTRPILMMPFNGSLVLYDKAVINPEKPQENMAASVKLPPDLKQAICVVLPNAAGARPAYRMLLLDDSERAFPGGESRVLSLINVETALQAGEHRLPVKPGQFTRVPSVSKVNDFNMAQTNFYYQKNGAWVAFTERQLQYLDACRRLFIVHATMGALNPTVTTIVDTMRSQNRAN
jgi:hypothetical protein